MKATSAFKLSKSAKRMLAVTDNKTRKADLKKLFIQSEIEYEHNQKHSRKFREKQEDA